MSLINCPECNHEMSDSARSCPNCGYKVKKPIDKKIIIGICIAVAVIGLIIFFVARGKTSYIVGEWAIDHYITEDGEIKQDDIGEYYGEQFQTANSIFTVVFSSNGKVTLNLPTYEGTETVSRECDYEIKGNDIFLFANGDRTRAFEIKSDMLIVYGISGFDGNVVLKKK